MSSMQEDPRIDPRIKAVMGAMPTPTAANVDSREQLLEATNTEAAITARQQMMAIMDMMDNEEVAPSAGLAITDHEFTSLPDQNAIKVRFIRPDSDERLPCVYYIHGGGMQVMSCYDGMYRAWGKIIAQQGVAVVCGDEVQ